MQAWPRCCWGPRAQDAAAAELFDLVGDSGFDAIQRLLAQRWSLACWSMLVVHAAGPEWGPACWWPQGASAADGQTGSRESFLHGQHAGSARACHSESAALTARLAWNAHIYCCMQTGLQGVNTRLSCRVKRPARQLQARSQSASHARVMLWRPSQQL